MKIHFVVHAHVNSKKSKIFRHCYPKACRRGKERQRSRFCCPRHFPRTLQTNPRRQLPRSPTSNVHPSQIRFPTSTRLNLSPGRPIETGPPAVQAHGCRISLASLKAPNPGPFGCPRNCQKGRQRVRGVARTTDPRLRITHRMHQKSRRARRARKCC
jgi:hypothetical protein